MSPPPSRVQGVCFRRHGRQGPGTGPLPRLNFGLVVIMPELPGQCLSPFGKVRLGDRLLTFTPLLQKLSARRRSCVL